MSTVLLMTPLLRFLAVYILAAILPAAFLLRYIYRHDTVEKEPPGLLFKLLVMERLGETVLNALVDPGSPVYTIILAFLVVALVEEGMKYLLLKRCTWRDPNFNYRFDGIVYAVFVSLGFAASENILYVLHYGLSVALPRALFAVPGHMSFAVFMGVFYGRAKLCEDCGQPVRKRLNLWRGYLTAVILHGFYDSCAMLGNTAAMLTFLVFVIIMYIRVYRLLRRESATDSPV